MLLLLRVQKSKKGWQVLNCSMLALVPATSATLAAQVQEYSDAACLLACVDEPCVLSPAYPSLASDWAFADGRDDAKPIRRLDQPATTTQYVGGPMRSARSNSFIHYFQGNRVLERPRGSNQVSKASQRTTPMRLAIWTGTTLLHCWGGCCNNEHEEQGGHSARETHHRASANQEKDAAGAADRKKKYKKQASTKHKIVKQGK